LALSVLATFLSLLAALDAVRPMSVHLARYSRPLQWFAFMLISATFLFLIYLFLSGDLSYLYVWSYTATDLSPIYKLSGVWAGASGSFLLWVWLISAIVTVEMHFGRRSKDGPGRDLQLAISCALSLAFLLLILPMGLFAPTVTGPTDAWRLALFPNGHGLALSLQTWEMVLHPAVVFAAYAFLIPVFAAATAFLFRGKGEWKSTAVRWGRCSWLLLTLGVGIGALWAYYVIGWGGYWSWDPVETSSLLIWIVLTALLHTLTRYHEGKEYSLLAPLLGIICFVTVLFAAFVTRAGGVWSSSVHTFGSPLGQGAGQRLLDVLSGNATVLGIFLLMFATLSLALYFTIRRRPMIAQEEERPFIVGDSNSMLFAVALLLFTAGVMLLLLLKNVDDTATHNFDEFNEKLSSFFAALMIVLVVCSSWRDIGSRRALWLGIGLSIVSVLAAIVGGLTGFYFMAALMVPSFVAAMVVAFYRATRTIVKRSWRKTLRNLGPQLVHLGIAFLLVGFVFSSFAQVAAANGAQVPVNVGSDLKVGEYSIVLRELSVQNVTPPADLSYNQVRVMRFDVLHSGSVVQKDAIIANYYEFLGTEAAKVKSQAYVHKSLGEDLYLSFDWQSSSTGLVQMKIVPLINLLWTGLVLLMVGVAMRIFVLPSKDAVSSGQTYQR